MKTRRKAQIWLYRRHAGKREALILRRRLDMEHGMAGIWQPVTGKVEKGEDFAAGARREASEETGVPLATPVVRIGGFEFDDRWGARSVEEIFAMEAPPGLEVTIDPDEHIEFAWVPLSEALARIKFPPPAEATQRLREIIDHG